MDLKETIEQAAERRFPHHKGRTVIASNKTMLKRAAFIKGAKWQELKNNTKKVLSDNLVRYKGVCNHSKIVVYGTGLFYDGYNLWLCNLEEGKTFSELTTYIIEKDSAELIIN